MAKPAWQNRQDTFGDRRALVIRTMETVFDLGSSDSPVSVLKAMIESEVPRTIVANGDIDGLLAAQMLSAVTDWKIGAVLAKSGVMWSHPAHVDLDLLLSSGEAYCVDVFNLHCPGVSNHPALWRPKRGKGLYKARLSAFDSEVTRAVERLGTLNLSVTAGVGAMQGLDSPHGLPYKYPLGATQVLLAALEISGHAPRLYDRQILPWVLADADGGLTTVRNYAWNAELWWNGLAAAVGPASLSEGLYRLAAEQRPNQKEDVDRRLRWEYGATAEVWKPDWNLRDSTRHVWAEHVGLVTAMSGWPDPFLGGAPNLSAWGTAQRTVGNLYVSGISLIQDAVLVTSLDAARASAHFNVNTFDARDRLSW